MSAELEKIDFEPLKQSIKITSVLERYQVKLRASGDWLIGKCPLPGHTGDGSFMVRPNDNFFMCKSKECIAQRGGKKGGDIVYFVSVMESVSQKQAAHKLAEWFGLAGGPTPAVEQKQVEPPIAEVKPGKATLAEKLNEMPKAMVDTLEATRQETAERFMTTLDRKLDAEFRKILEWLIVSDEAEPADRFMTAVINLKKVAKREVLESYRNGRDSVLKAS